jgi:hypothetical protein
MLIRGSGMTVTTVSIRLAFKKIAKITCGISPKVIPVKVSGTPGERVFFVTVPFEYKAEVCAYLSKQLGIHHALDVQPLLLTSREASWLVELALNGDAGQVAETADAQLSSFVS